jgi:hypothetical protein
MIFINPKPNRIWHGGTIGERGTDAGFDRQADSAAALGLACAY